MAQKQNKTRPGLGIFHKTLLTLLLVALVPLAGIWSVNYRSTIAELARQADTELGAVTSELVSYVDSWVDMNHRMLRQNAMLAGMRSMRADLQDPILAQIVDVYDWTYLAFTVAPNGDNIGRSDGQALKFYGDREYVQQVLAGQPLGQQVLVSRTTGKPAFILSVPVHDDSGTLVGVLAAGTSIADISDRVARTRIGETGSAFLVDPSGRVIAHQDEAFTRERKDLANHPAFQAARQVGQTRATFVDESGVRMIAAMAKTRQGWILVAQQPYSEAFAAVSDANRQAILLLGATVLVVILVAWLVTARLTSPIRNLTRIADAISRGGLDQTIAETARADEIGALARAIERLGTSVRYAMERLRRATPTAEVR